MWLAVGGTKLAMASVGVLSVITTDVLNKLIGTSVNSIGSILGYFVSESSEDTISKRYKNDIEIMDIPMKLEFVANWIETYKQKEEKNELTLGKNDTLLYHHLSDIIQKIHAEIKTIEEKINYHKTRWFHTWRVLYLNTEIENLEKYIKILDERLKFIY